MFMCDTLITVYQYIYNDNNMYIIVYIYIHKYLSLPPFSKGNTQCIYINLTGDVWWMRNALKCFEYQTQKQIDGEKNAREIEGT